MEQKNVDINEVLKKLTNQISQQALTIAMLEVYNEDLTKQITELQEQVPKVSKKDEK